MALLGPVPCNSRPKRADEGDAMTPGSQSAQSHIAAETRAEIDRATTAAGGLEFFLVVAFG